MGGGDGVDRSCSPPDLLLNELDQTVKNKFKKTSRAVMYHCRSLLNMCSFGIARRGTESLVYCSDGRDSTTFFGGPGELKKRFKVGRGFPGQLSESGTSRSPATAFAV